MLFESPTRITFLVGVRDQEDLLLLWWCTVCIAKPGWLGKGEGVIPVCGLATGARPVALTGERRGLGSDRGGAWVTRVGCSVPAVGVILCLGEGTEGRREAGMRPKAFSLIVGSRSEPRSELVWVQASVQEVQVNGLSMCCRRSKMSWSFSWWCCSVMVSTVCSHSSAARVRR